MKNLFILILSTTFLLSCNQIKSNNEKTATNDNNEQVADTTNKVVYLTAERATIKLSAIPESINVIMTNNTTDTITTGLHYSIEKLIGYDWQEVSPKDIVFNDLGWRLKPTDTENFEKKLFKDQIDYKPGKYRIVKYYLKSDYQKTKQNYNIYAEFNIEE